MPYEYYFVHDTFHVNQVINSFYFENCTDHILHHRAMNHTRFVFASRFSHQLKLYIIQQLTLTFSLSEDSDFTYLLAY